jgi:hypothetical protein
VVRHPDYDHVAIASIAFNDCRDDGMPATGEELSAIDGIEDQFRDLLQQGEESLLAVVVTTDGRRDLIFYTSNAKGAIRKFEDKLSPRMDTHQVEFTIRPDAKWGIYSQFA